MTARFDRVTTITVTSPNGGESWQVGTTHNITWTSTAAGSTVRIELYSGTSRYARITSSTPNDGSYSWSIPSNYLRYTNYRIRVTDIGSGVYDQSNSYFTLVYPPTVTVTSPNGGESWQVGTTHNITWTTTNAGSTVWIGLYSGTSRYATITSSTANDGSYPWSIPSNYSPRTNYRILVTDLASGEYDLSYSFFTLTAPLVTAYLKLNVSTDGQPYFTSNVASWREYVGYRRESAPAFYDPSWNLCSSSPLMVISTGILDDDWWIYPNDGRYFAYGLDVDASTTSVSVTIRGQLRNSAFVSPTQGGFYEDTDVKRTWANKFSRSTGCQESTVTLGSSYLGTGRTEFNTWYRDTEGSLGDLDAGIQWIEWRFNGWMVPSSAPALSPSGPWRARDDGGPDTAGQLESGGR